MATEFSFTNGEEAAERLKENIKEMTTLLAKLETNIFALTFGKKFLSIVRAQILLLCLINPR